MSSYFLHDGDPISRGYSPLSWVDVYFIIMLLKIPKISPSSSCKKCTLYYHKGPSTVRRLRWGEMRCCICYHFRCSWRADCIGFYVFGILGKNLTIYLFSIIWCIWLVIIYLASIIYLFWLVIEKKRISGLCYSVKETRYEKIYIIMFVRVSVTELQGLLYCLLKRTKRISKSFFKKEEEEKSLHSFYHSLRKSKSRGSDEGLVQYRRNRQTRQ